MTAAAFGTPFVVSAVQKAWMWKSRGRLWAEQTGETEMNQRNYQKELEKILEKLSREKEQTGTAPTLLLHSCCAPCSSYVLKYLREYFHITVFYYNPNISQQEEYRHRVEEQKRLIGIYNEQLASGQPGYPIEVVEGDYEPEKFFAFATALKDVPEGGERCFQCFDLRLRKTAELAKQGEFTYFATTLTISPLKNAGKLNEVGEQLEKEYGVSWLPSDFKKKNGYRQSVELSAEYGLYRQDYCGCIYSRLERERQKTTCQMDIKTLR